jgi:hypothetical protein
LILVSSRVANKLSDLLNRRFADSAIQCISDRSTGSSQQSKSASFLINEAKPWLGHVDSPASEHPCTGAQPAHACSKNQASCSGMNSRPVLRLDRDKYMTLQCHGAKELETSACALGSIKDECTWAKTLIVVDFI